MIYKQLGILFFFVLLTACSLQNDLSNKKVNVEVKEEGYTREISDEEQKYIQLVLDKEYENLEEITENSEEEVKLDYYKIAFAIKKQKEAQELENNGIDESVIPDVQEVEMKYYFALDKLESVKYIPKELDGFVKQLKSELQERENYYKPLIEEFNKQKEIEREQVRIYDANRKADFRTENPQPVSIGMTIEEVLTEGWGRPKDVNKTTTANGVNEQWVYSGYKFLYFEDGILTTIQE